MVGAKLRDEDFLDCWKFSGSEVLIKLLVVRPEINKLSPKDLNELAIRTVHVGLTDVLRTLVKKGERKNLYFVCDQSIC